jgi:cytosine/adenosine deaminase-related metal-dependent hydrolase
MSASPHINDRFLRFDAAGAADGRGLSIGPASVLVRIQSAEPSPHLEAGFALVLAIGTPGEVDAHEAAPAARRIALPNRLLIPALVNAHAHLDLTHIGPRPLDIGGGFSAFVDLVRRERATDEWGALHRSVQSGILMSMAGGIVAVGDIGGAPMGIPTITPYETLAPSHLGGVSYLEFFAIGNGEDRGRARLSETLRTQALDPEETTPVLPTALGIQPHAPTTVSLATYQWLLDQPECNDRRLCTHLAETREEHEFIAHARGPHRAFLESLGLWDDRMLEEIGRARTPVAHMAEVLARAPFLCAHVNDASDRDIELLTKTPTSVAYCPRASDYFRAHSHFGPHRYRDMLASGINVCLGTDSIINLPPGTDRLSTLDEVRFLYRRDKTDPITLLSMATVNGARALGLAEEEFTFKVGSPLAGMVAVPFQATAGLTAWEAVLLSDSAPELILIGK